MSSATLLVLMWNQARILLAPGFYPEKWIWLAPDQTYSDLKILEFKALRK